MRLTELTIRSLEDKSSQVRKNCIALLTKLILTHPYGMHGGELSLSDWQDKFDALERELTALDLPSVEEAAALAEARELMRDNDDEGPDQETSEANGTEDDGGETPRPSDRSDGDASEDEDATPRKSDAATGTERKQKRRSRKSGIDIAAADQSQMLAQVDQETLMRLRLTKKYYSDAIGFVQQLERAVDVIADLLASTVKSEVLEAMEFFKVASQYKLEAADVS